MRVDEEERTGRNLLANKTKARTEVGRGGEKSLRIDPGLEFTTVQGGRKIKRKVRR